MRAFLDTNVWLSARFRPGLCAQLLEMLVEAGAVILLDERVHSEFRWIARDKLHVDESALARADVFFQEYAVIVPAVEHAAPNVSDTEDARIVAAALAAGSTWFVTGDKALLDLSKVEAMSILNPRKAYEHLRGLR